MATVSAMTRRSSSSQVRSIIVAGLVIGVVGGIDQTTFFVLTEHFTPVTVFQFIASALLGLAAFAGGYTTALLGLLIHLVVSFVVAGVFILAASSIAFLRRTVFVSAIVYGAAVSIIGGLALPFTAAPKLPVTTLAVVHSVVADALLLGMPLAIIVWQSTRVNNAIATA
jgi:hypothetical protein